MACKRRSEEHTSELQSQSNLVCRLLLEKTKAVLPDISAAQALQCFFEAAFFAASLGVFSHSIRVDYRTISMQQPRSSPTRPCGAAGKHGADTLEYAAGSLLDLGGRHSFMAG